jgi:MFS family permease
VTDDDTQRISPRLPFSAEERARSLRLSVVDGLLHAVMVGASESYLGALAVELGHSDQSLALLATAPLLAGALAQLVSEPLARAFGARRRFVALFAALQACAHLSFIAIALTDEQRLWPLLLAKVSFWITGSAIAPAWGAWMGSLTEGLDRQRYFAWRSSAVSLALLCSFALAGALLSRAGAFRLSTFAALFTAALVARLLSALALSRKGDPDEACPAPREPLWPTLRLAALGSRWRIATYIAALMVAAHLSVPFFTPYMLKELRLDYLSFAALISMSILTKALTFPLLHRLAARVGLRVTLGLGGLGVSLVPVLWGIFVTFEQLLVVQALSGVAWGALELASFQLLLKSSRPWLRAAFLSLASCLTSAAQIAGALFGSWLLEIVGLSYTEAFVLSGIARALPLVLLVSGAAKAFAGGSERLVSRVESVRPAGGVVRRFFLVGPARRPPGR